MLGGDPRGPGDPRESAGTERRRRPGIPTERSGGRETEAESLQEVSAKSRTQTAARGRRERETVVQTGTGEPDRCGPTDRQRPGRAGGRAGGVMRERGGPGGADWLADAGVGGAAGGWAAGEPAGPSPRAARRRRVPLRLPRPRCARASASLRPGVLRGHRRLLGPAFRGPLGGGDVPLGRGLGLRVSVLVSCLCSQSGSGSEARGGGRFWPVPPPFMPRPGAQIPASGGGRETPGPSTRPGPRLLRRAGQPEPEREREARPSPATCPGRSTLGLRTPSPSSLRPTSPV